MSQFERLQKAAALKYSENGTDSAPVVVASGSGHIAQTIIDIAEKNGVPVFRDNSLATLLSQLQCDTEIPPELYRAVVDIYVYFLGFRVDQNGKVVRGAPPEKSPEGPSAEIDKNQ
jgi:flagellar biosynthesis protein